MRSKYSSSISHQDLYHPVPPQPGVEDHGWEHRETVGLGNPDPGPGCCFRLLVEGPSEQLLDRFEWAALELLEAGLPGRGATGGEAVLRLFGQRGPQANLASHRQLLLGVPYGELSRSAPDPLGDDRTSEVRDGVGDGLALLHHLPPHVLV